MRIEVHITTSEIISSEIDRFISFCRSIEAKPIIIELPEGEVSQHPMISKRVKVNNRQELDVTLINIKSRFQENNYLVTRVKLEVFSEESSIGALLFPEFKGGYYEWHGKVYSDNLDEVYRIAKIAKVHISRNGLKGIKSRRILTIRESENEGYFLDKIDRARGHFTRNGIDIVSEESEYCIYDSNKSLDKGWINTPEITNKEYLDILSFEAFIRRAASLDLPFMLKGSILTRQFLSNKKDRVVRDIDYLYFGKVKDDIEFMSNELSNWVEVVTSSNNDDDVKYRKFSENKFWRAIDYAMNDDFPTTNTDLYCIVRGTVNPAVGLDVSWGLPLNIPAESITYTPLEGEPFEIKYTAPLSLQISWKLHQCVVRPRLKDIIDICCLLGNANPSGEDIKTAAQEFIKECRKDGINEERIICFMNGSLESYIIQKNNEHSLREVEQPLPNMGELEMPDIEYLKYTFPNYYLKYSNISDILKNLRELMDKFNFKEIFEKNKSNE